MWSVKFDTAENALNTIVIVILISAALLVVFPKRLVIWPFPNLSILLNFYSYYMLFNELITCKVHNIQHLKITQYFMLYLFSLSHTLSSIDILICVWVIVIVIIIVTSISITVHCHVIVHMEIAWITRKKKSRIL